MSVYTSKMKTLNLRSTANISYIGSMYQPGSMLELNDYVVQGPTHQVAMFLVHLNRLGLCYLKARSRTRKSWSSVSVQVTIEGQPRFSVLLLCSRALARELKAIRLGLGRPMQLHLTAEGGRLI